MGAERDHATHDRAVADTVAERGPAHLRRHEVELLPVRLGDFRWLSRARRADLVFNLCEGINGYARFEDFVVGTLELTGFADEDVAARGGVDLSDELATGPPSR